MSTSGVLRDARLRAPARRRTARPDTVTARVAGALLIAATVASLLSTALLNPVFSGSDYLFKISAHQDRILAGGFFEIVAAFASAGIAVSLYPVVRRHGESLALGSVGFRLLEGGLYLLAAIGTFLLLQVGCNPVLDIGGNRSVSGLRRSPLRPDRIRWSNRDNDAQNWWIWTRSRTRAFTA